MWLPYQTAPLQLLPQFYLKRPIEKDLEHFTIFVKKVLPVWWEWILQEIRKFPVAVGFIRAVVKVMGVISTVTRLWSNTFSVCPSNWMLWISGVEPRPIRCQDTTGPFWHMVRPDETTITEYLGELFELIIVHVHPSITSKKLRNKSVTKWKNKK